MGAFWTRRALQTSIPCPSRHPRWLQIAHGVYLIVEKVELAAVLVAPATHLHVCHTSPRCIFLSGAFWTRRSLHTSIPCTSRPPRWIQIDTIGYSMVGKGQLEIVAVAPATPSHVWHTSPPCIFLSGGFLDKEGSPHLHTLPLQPLKVHTD